MAYAYTVSGPVTDEVDGSRTWTIVESEIGTSSEWEIGLPWELCHVVLHVADLVTAGSATTIQPELGTDPGWTSGGAAHVDQADAADANHRIGQHKTIFAPKRRLYGRSVPDTGTGASGRIVTTITIRPGAVK